MWSVFLLLCVLPQQPIEAKPSLDHIARTLPDAALLDWLRDDDIRWNATAAARELARRMADPARRAPLSPQLDRLLDDPDPQLQAVVVGNLQRLALEEPPAYTFDRRLIRASIAQLDHYTTCHGGDWLWNTTTQAACVDFLLRCRPRAGAALDQELRLGFRRAAPMDRWIFAFLLSGAGPAKDPRTDRPLVDALLPHLAANAIHDDALMALEALYRLGPAQLPHHRAALAASTDPQQRRALRLLIGSLDPTAPDGLLQSQLPRRHRLTWKVADPARQWRFVSHRH